MWVSVGGYCSFLAICFCQMFICTSDKSIWTFEKPQEALPFSTPASYLQSHPMLQSGSRQIPGRQREGTSPSGQADAGCRAIPITAKRSGLGVKWSLSSYRSASHSRVEGVPFWEGKASKEKEKVWHLCYFSSLLGYQRIFKPLQLRPRILLVPLALATVRLIGLKVMLQFSLCLFFFFF